MFKVRKILWRIYVVRFKQNLLNKFRYPYIQHVFSPIFPIDVNISTDKMSGCKHFSLLQNLCSNLDISTLKYSTETSVYNLYYVWEFSKLKSQAFSVNISHMFIDSVQSISARLLIHIELLYRQRRTKNSVSLTFLNICACTSNTFCEHRTLWSTIQVCAA